MKKSIYFALLSVFASSFALAEGTVINKVTCSDKGGYSHRVSIGVFADTSLPENERYASIRIDSLSGELGQAVGLYIDQVITENNETRTYDGPAFNLVAVPKENGYSTLTLKDNQNSVEMNCIFDLPGTMD